MTKKRTPACPPGMLTIHLDPVQMEQFQNICTILMESPEELAREMVLNAMWKETLQVLKSVAISYSLDELPGMQGTRTGRTSSTSRNLTELDPPTLQGTLADLEHHVPQAQAQTQAGKKGLRGGEADEESLPPSPRNADLERYVVQAIHQSVQGQAAGQLTINAPGSQP